MLPILPKHYFIIDLHGGASWLYQIFVNMFSDSIKNSVQNALQDAITQNINDGLNNTLSTIPIEQQLSSQVEIDFPLVANPIFTTSYFTLPQLGNIKHKISEITRIIPINIDWISSIKIYFFPIIFH